MSPLSVLLLDSIDHAPLREAVAGLPGLERTLEAHLGHARTTFPGVRVADAAVLALVARWLGAVGAGTLTDGEAKIAELFVASGCADGDGAALAAFEARYFPPLAGIFGRMRLSTAMADEAKQLVRMKLLVAEPGERPRIEQYAIGGDLAGLLRVVATRTAISLLRKESAERRADDDDLIALMSPATGPEQRYVRAEHQGAVRAAFQRAITALESRERNLLRLHLIDRLSIDEIGALYRVHRATAARWIDRIRESLDGAVRGTLTEGGAIAVDELESLLQATRSQLDLSLERLLVPSIAPGK